jgi:tetratricopeptide (TPR) repeat protein
MAYRGQDQNEKAEAALQQAVDIFEKLAKEHPDVLEYAYDVGRCYIEFGKTANHAGRHNAALARHEKAIATLKDVLDRGYGGARNSLLGARIDRTLVRAGRGEHAQAAAEAEALVQKEELTAAHLYDLACVFSLSAAAAERDDKLSPTGRGRLKSRYADRAMEFLQRAVAEGWQNPQALKTDRDMEPLRTREDLRKLLADLEAKSKE